MGQHKGSKRGFEGGGRLPLWMLDLDNQMEEHMEQSRPAEMKRRAGYTGYAQALTDARAQLDYFHPLIQSSWKNEPVNTAPLALPDENRFPRWLKILIGVTACAAGWAGVVYVFLRLWEAQ